MKWSDEHDIFFLKELVHFRPWLHKKGTVERSEIWGKLAIKLNNSRNLDFRVTQRSIRDKCLLLERRYKKKINQEETESGISLDASEIDQLMEKIVDLFEEADRTETEKKRTLEEEASQIEEMRKISLESFRETKEREKNGKQDTKKKRMTGADSIAFLRDKVKMESEWKMKDLELRKQEMETKKELREAEMKMRKLEQEERIQQQEANTRLQSEQIEQLNKINMAMLQQ